MHPEHEEAMRTAFADYIDLQQQMPDAEEDRIEQIADQLEHIDHQWQSGPHQQHWQYLHDARHDWDRSPKAMLTMLHDLHHDNPTAVTDVQWRSLLQTGDIALHKAHSPLQRELRELAASRDKRTRGHRPDIERGR